MRIRKTMLAAALAAFAFAALPAIASANKVDYPGAGNFTVKNEGNTTLKAGSTSVTCTGLSGEGHFNNEHEGSVRFMFTGCTSSGTKCESTGAPEKGTITTTTLPFDVVEVRHPTHETNAGPGVLVTPGEGGHYATFKCAFGLVHVEVHGNGVIGTLSSPECGKSSKELTLKFEEDGSKHQTHRTAVDTTGKVATEEFDLKATVNEGEAITAAQVGNGTITFTEGEGKVTCTGE